MVTKSYVCPHCKQSEPVVRFGFTEGGRQRLRCKACQRTWSPQAKSRTLSAEKEALIARALGEKLSQRAIARALGAGRETVRAVLQKSHTKLG
jgi:transposase-like protein